MKTEKTKSEASVMLNIKEDCPCKRVKCERHGYCDVCRKHHLENKKNEPACDRLEEKLVMKKQREERKV